MKTFTELYQDNVKMVRETVDGVVEWMFSGCDEIGSSDISCCVHSICRDLDVATVQDDEFAFIRGMVRNSIAMMSY